jgi:GH35 family endo-1,4-beta-xylanase
MKKRLFVLGALAALSAGAAFDLDRSVMSEAYWRVWNDEVQARIDSDIEKYRKADATVPVDAPDGAVVSVEQLSHRFFFGAHIFNFNQLGKKEWNDRYKELYGTLFNSATVAFYWRTLEPFASAPRFEERYEDTENFWNRCPHPKEQAHWRRPAPDPVISFLRARGVRIHGHPLVWGDSHWQTPTWLWTNFCPDDEKEALARASGVTIPHPDAFRPAGTCDRQFSARWYAAWRKVYARLSDEEIARLIPTFLAEHEKRHEARVRAIAARYGSRVDSWDVVNESATDFHAFGRKAVRGKPFDRSHYGPMPADYARKAFAWAQEFLPARAWLNINEYNMGPFFDQVNDLLAQGARIDVIGSQMHLFNPAESVKIARGEFSPEVYGKTHPAAIEKTFGALSRANRPIHLSEITITAPDASARGQMVQAVILHNLYRAWFAVEKMNGITWWNVVDDCGAPGEPSISGLFTRDMRPKTAFYAMDDLVNRVWKTSLKVPAAKGAVTFRGFRGRYRLSWTRRDGTAASTVSDVK